MTRCRTIPLEAVPGIRQRQAVCGARIGRSFHGSVDRVTYVLINVVHVGGLQFVPEQHAGYVPCKHRERFACEGLWLSTHVTAT